MVYNLFTEILMLFVSEQPHQNLDDISFTGVDTKLGKEEEAKLVGAAKEFFRAKDRAADLSFKSLVDLLISFIGMRHYHGCCL